VWCATGICIEFGSACVTAAVFSETEVSVDHPGDCSGSLPLRDGGPGDHDFSTESNTNRVPTAASRRAESGRVEAIRAQP
jgi:hypothetical protein